MGDYGYKFVAIGQQGIPSLPRRQLGLTCTGHGAQVLHLPCAEFAFQAPRVPRSR
jgi:hypothetical protein